MAEPRRSAGTESDDVAGARILVVEARFYADISDALLKGATRVLDEAGVTYDKISVPGSLEIAPAIAMALEASEKAGKPIEGAVALGCVIRGETLHFEIVSQESARALIELSVRRGIPIGNASLDWRPPKPVEVFCRGCTSSYPAGTKFCGRCGKPISA